MTHRMPTLALALAASLLAGPQSAGVTAARGDSRMVWSVASTAPVGALFHGSMEDGDHSCTASVVSSEGRDMLVTAAHCLDGISIRDLTFVPGYHDGVAPYGEWDIAWTSAAPEWNYGGDEDADVGFAAVEPKDGVRIQDVVGAYALGIDQAPDSTVTVTGYPSDFEVPVTCTGTARAYTDQQWIIGCPGFSGGTSGSPWVTADGKVVGVIGGHEQGGDTDDISYSVRFDADTEELFQKADD
ncbi:trypsin-like peptidase domain-containing protein [Streptomyces sp. NPDC050738]|uniref:trypsin-like serine peptidase n=1 Tax=Streptomyces sp. NPDC050738 TaxID=3154744 RepID=UPI0034339991